MYPEKLKVIAQQVQLQQQEQVRPQHPGAPEQQSLAGGAHSLSQPPSQPFANRVVPFPAHGQQEAAALPNRPQQMRRGGRHILGEENKVRVPS